MRDPSLSVKGMGKWDTVHGQAGHRRGPGGGQWARHGASILLSTFYGTGIDSLKNVPAIPTNH